MTKGLRHGECLKLPGLARDAKHLPLNAGAAACIGRRAWKRSAGTHQKLHEATNGFVGSALTYCSNILDLGGWNCHRADETITIYPYFINIYIYIYIIYINIYTLHWRSIPSKRLCRQTTTGKRRLTLGNRSRPFTRMHCFAIFALPNQKRLNWDFWWRYALDRGRKMKEDEQWSTPPNCMLQERACSTICITMYNV